MPPDTQTSQRQESFHAGDLTEIIYHEYKQHEMASSGTVITDTSSKSENIDVDDLYTSPHISWSFSPAPIMLRTLSSATQEITWEEAPVSKQIADVQNLRSIPFANKLADRLEYLVRTSEEEFPDQEPISPESLRDFIAFISRNKNLVYPAVVLTYSGNIRAEWTSARNKHFAVEFSGANDVRFVIFSPDSHVSSKTNRVSGQTTIDSLMDIARPYGISAWVFGPQEHVT